MTINLDAFERDMNNAHNEVQRFTKWKEDVAQLVHNSFLAQNFNHFSNTVLPTYDDVDGYIDEAYWEVRDCLVKQKEESAEEYDRVELKVNGGGF